MMMTRLHRDNCERSRAHEGYNILLKCLYDAHGRFERKNAAQKGKWKMRSVSRIRQRASITKLLIISINGLMHLFRSVKTVQGLVSLTLPASLSWVFRYDSVSFLFSCIKISDNDLTLNLLLTYTLTHVDWIHRKIRFDTGPSGMKQLP